MDEVQVILASRIAELTRIIERAEDCLLKSPKGSLQVSKSNGTVQFYHVSEGLDSCRSYIKKSEAELVEQLAQKDYAQKIYRSAKEERDKLSRCLSQYNPMAVVDVYENMLEARKSFITPYILSDEQYIKQWKEEKQRQKANYGKDDLLLLPEEEAIITEQGERVRSKSEKILADKFYMMNIPYVYECPLYVAGYGIIKPDFMTLNVRVREEYVWEHLGLMDDKEYSTKAIRKIETYERNQIYPGRKLILTYEADHHPLNMKLVEGIIKEYLI